MVAFLQHERPARTACRTRRVTADVDAQEDAHRLALAGCACGAVPAGSAAVRRRGARRDRRRGRRASPRGGGGLQDRSPQRARDRAWWRGASQRRRWRFLRLRLRLLRHAVGGKQAIELCDGGFSASASGTRDTTDSIRSLAPRLVTLVHRRGARGSAGAATLSVVSCGSGCQLFAAPPPVPSVTKSQRFRRRWCDRVGYSSPVAASAGAVGAAEDNCRASSDALRRGAAPWLNCVANGRTRRSSATSATHERVQPFDAWLRDR